MNPAPTPKAYSYVRFSTPEQRHGDSIRRQTSMAAEYCARHGLTLDTELTMSDEGVSAYRGKNLDGTAALGAFLAAVKAGDVPQGSVLLVEALDRITRKTANRAAAIVQDIVDAGVDVVTLNDGKRYTQASLNDGMDYVFLVILAMRAHEESRTKGRRVAQAASARRKAAAETGKTFSRITPGWITVTADGKRELIPERAAVIRRIFELFTSGAGCESIARTLETEGIPTFGRGQSQAKHWHKSYVHKILRSDTVLGVFTPHTDDGTTRTPQAPIPGYYPAVVDRELWDRAQALIATNQSRRPATASTKTQNALAGLAKCPHCDSSMTRVWKGAKNGAPKLVCSFAKVGGTCPYVSVPLPTIEVALQKAAREPLPAPTSWLGESLQVLDDEIKALDKIIAGLVESIEQSASKALMDALKAREASRDTLLADRAELVKQVAAADSRMFKRRSALYRAAMSATPFDAGAANLALREMVTKVVVDYERQSLRMHWRHDGETEVTYG